jgi:lipid A 3-O-deacylase
MRKIVVSIMVVFGSALATLSEGAEIELGLPPTDPTPVQPASIEPPLTLATQEGNSRFVIAGDERAFAPQPNSIWQGEVGEGFQSDVRTFSIETGVALGVQAFGGRQVHDLALLSLSYGHMLGNVVGGDHWYHGNWEARAELFGGGQFSPRSDELIGLAPHLRYNLATGTRWVPFADFGAGVTASGIGPPDQSGTFEFNLQANVGTHWFVRDNLALTFEAGYLHMSCAGLHDPNLGVNSIKGMVGLTWFI